MEKANWPAAKVVDKKVSDLVPYARNSRQHSPEQVAQVAASIKEWGWTIPVLISEDSTIIAGHARIMAAQKLGIEKVPCMVAKGWSDAKIRAYVIADNKLALNSSWDMDVLANEMAELEDLEFDVGLVGFTDVELEHLTSNEEAVKARSKETVSETTQSTTWCSLGSIKFKVSGEDYEALLTSFRSEGYFTPEEHEDCLRRRIFGDES